MKKQPLRILTVLLLALTVLQLAFFYYLEPLGKMPESVTDFVGWLLVPGIFASLVLPFSPEMYSSYPALLLFPIAANSVIYVTLIFCLWLLKTTFLARPQNP